jgi:hypothetical protein
VHVIAVYYICDMVRKAVLSVHNNICLQRTIFCSTTVKCCQQLWGKPISQRCIVDILRGGWEKGTCENLRALKGTKLERTCLDGLSHYHHQHQGKSPLALLQSSFG